MATPSNKTKLTIDIPAELKLQLKVHCASNQLNMTDVVESLIGQYLSNQKQEGAM